MSKKTNQSVSERAVRGAVGGWVCGEVKPFCPPWTNSKGEIIRLYAVIVQPEAVERMLADERKAAKKGKRK